MKLWGADGTVADNYALLTEQFTTGRDKEMDLYLARYDVLASLAHGQMLASIGLLTDAELKEIQSALHAILSDIDAGTFTIGNGVEDVHSEIEFRLTQMVGDTGKKIHSGRSRNDQSLTAIKLFLKDEIMHIATDVAQLFQLLITLSERYKHDLLPGYTHTQLAMPSSFGLWFAAWAESLSDDMELLIAAYNMVNRNPLGSGAGYGSSFPLNRELTTQLMGFGGMNVNVVYAQMTRGKTEKTVAIAIAGIAATLSRLSADVCLFCNQNMAFVSFPPAFTTGSSIMPHKKNPDVFELVRGHCNGIQALPSQLTLLTTNLTSGYHRDVQLTKEYLFPAMQQLKLCIKMVTVAMENISVVEGILERAGYDMLYTVEVVNNLVLQGVPFRDAYRRVAHDVANGTFIADKTIQHSHTGSMGNLCNDLIIQDFYRRIRIIAPNFA